MKAAFFIIVAMTLLVLELALEIRSHKRGYDTLIIGALMNNEKESVNIIDEIEYGPTKDFPFPSRIIKNKQADLNIWVSSASHAIYGAPINKSFPNLLCSYITVSSCNVVNGSEAGWDIEQSVYEYEKSADQYNISYVAFYHLSQDLLAFMNKPPAKMDDTPTTNPLVDFTYLHKKLEETTIYAHVSRYVRGNIVLQALLDNELDDDFASAYIEKLDHFIKIAKDKEHIPILTTFAASYGKAGQKMPHRVRLTLVRYQQKVSPEFFRAEVVRLNQATRNYAKQHNILLLDLANEIGGQPEFFQDFVHFNELGHEKFSVLLADLISENM